MNADLFLKRVPTVVKELIGREAAENRRSINQEAIALLEEALLSRVAAHRTGRRQARIDELRDFAQQADSGFDSESPDPAAAPANPPPTSTH